MEQINTNSLSELRSMYFHLCDDLRLPVRREASRQFLACYSAFGVSHRPVFLSRLHTFLHDDVMRFRSLASRSPSKSSSFPLSPLSFRLTTWSAASTAPSFSSATTKRSFAPTPLSHRKRPSANSSVSESACPSTHFAPRFWTWFCRCVAMDCRRRACWRSVIFFGIPIGRVSTRIRTLLSEPSFMEVVFPLLESIVREHTPELSEALLPLVVTLMALNDSRARPLFEQLVDQWTDGIQLFFIFHYNPIIHSDALVDRLVVSRDWRQCGWRVWKDRRSDVGSRSHRFGSRNDLASARRCPLAANRARCGRGLR